jgi:hypothetical protein
MGCLASLPSNRDDGNAALRRLVKLWLLWRRKLRPLRLAGIHLTRTRTLERGATGAAGNRPTLFTRSMRPSGRSNMEPPTMATIKEIIDQEKPVFDYLNYALRLAAWGSAWRCPSRSTETTPIRFSMRSTWWRLVRARRSDSLRSYDSAS